MAHLFKPTYSVRNKETGVAMTKKAKHWYVEYLDAQGIRRRKKGYTDKAASQQLLAELVKRTSLEQEGVVDPCAEHRQRPLVEHLSAYRTHLKAKGDTEKYIDETVASITTVVGECRFLVIRDLSASRFSRFLADLREKGRSPRTLNSYLTAIKGYSRWLVRDYRSERDVFAHLSRINEQSDRRHERRHITQKQFANLIRETKKAPPFRGLSGPDRAMLYMVAAYTGLRRAELASLTPKSFDLGSSSPVVTVEAASSKHRQKDQLPLKSDLAAKLACFLVRKIPSAPLWPGTWRNRSADMIKADLALAKIPYKDEIERAFDFHALRHQFLSSLAEQKVHPSIAQKLARHSTITLTMDRYTHLHAMDLQGALESLPKLPDDSTQMSESAKATGTDEILGVSLGVSLGVRSVFSCPSVSSGGKDAVKKTDADNEIPTSLNGDPVSVCPDESLADIGKKSGRPGGTRTPNPLIWNQVR